VPFDNFAKLRVDFGLVRAIAASEEEARAAFDETFVLVRPLYDFQIAGGGGLDGDLGEGRW